MCIMASGFDRPGHAGVVSVEWTLAKNRMYSMFDFIFKNLSGMFGVILQAEYF